MDPSDFQSMILRVIAIGLFVVGVGTVALVIAFRALGGQNERRGVMTLVAAIVFILIVCAVLFRWSYVAR